MSGYVKVSTVLSEDEARALLDLVADVSRDYSDAAAVDRIGAAGQLRVALEAALGVDRHRA
ncbi:hypothetical protein [Actinomyces provencensis]|uniref:hypothetical protein n=1 Tax=Actinomyces provencensis TaxID=1720198 RepID=UPI00096A2E06|nr:hypothetical protein [Actinomyces provencensis]